jgi:hypothetical protein
MDELEKRFKEAKKTIEPTKCIGTLLYLCGKRNEDIMVDTPVSFYDFYFSRVKRINFLKRGDIILWEQIIKDKEVLEKYSFIYRFVNGKPTQLIHGAVFIDFPLKIYDRIGCYVEDYGNASLKEKNLLKVNLKIRNFSLKRLGPIIMNFYRWKD